MLLMGATGADVGVKTGGRVGMAFMVFAGAVMEGAVVAEDIATRLIGLRSSSSSRLRFREPPMARSPLSGWGGSEYGGSPFDGMYQAGCD